MIKIVTNINYLILNVKLSKNYYNYIKYIQLKYKTSI